MELIKIKQLPVLEEQFKALGEQIDEKVDKAVKLVVTEDNYKDIKKIRAALNKESKSIADDFKAVKAEVLGPWTAVEEAYKKNVLVKYRTADSDLGDKIRSVEAELKARKTEELETYFDELKTAEGIDFISLQDAGIKVGLSDSKKKLKQAAKDFVERVAGDLKLIDSEENSAEILVEYRKTLCASQAITMVRERHEEVRRQEEALKAEEEAKKKAEEHDEEVMKHAEPLQAPVQEPDRAEVPERVVTFKVYFRDPAELQELAAVLSKYKFEQI